MLGVGRLSEPPEHRGWSVLRPGLSGVLRPGQCGPAGLRWEDFLRRCLPSTFRFSADSSGARGDTHVFQGLPGAAEGLGGEPSMEGRPALSWGRGADPVLGGRPGEARGPGAPVGPAESLRVGTRAFSTFLVLKFSANLRAPGAPFRSCWSPRTGLAPWHLPGKARTEKQRGEKGQVAGPPFTPPEPFVPAEEGAGL